MGAGTAWGGRLACTEDFSGGFKSHSFHHILVRFVYTPLNTNKGMNMWKCKYCAIEFENFNTSQKANHSRWCEQNPRKVEFKTNSKTSIRAKETNEQKLGIFKLFTVSCDRCKHNFQVTEREKQFPLKSRYFCSRSCANARNHSEETKAKISRSIDNNHIINGVKTEYKPLSFSHICKYCGVEFSTHKKNSKLCSVKCANSIRRLNSNSIEEYRRLCAFKFNLADYPNEFDFDLIREYGWYKPKNKGNNLNGVSRDHLISVRYGFDNKIDPKILSHPANCKLMQHNNNVSKYTTCELSLEQLLERIDQWNEKYPLTKD